MSVHFFIGLVCKPMALAVQPLRGYPTQPAVKQATLRFHHRYTISHIYMLCLERPDVEPNAVMQPYADMPRAFPTSHASHMFEAVCRSDNMVLPRLSYS